ncbi:hypothetical protein JXA88_16325 [Candidatus Fermentibacteria bacterium]|nr:hypothetical protein [Candidatus Fermentibacteria bacterium]
MSATPASQSPLAGKEHDSIRFYVAKDLPYSRRMLIGLLLSVAACALQIATLNALAGLPFLIAAALFVAVRGYDSRIRFKTFDIDPAWKPVSIERIRELETLRKRAKEWDRDAFDASNPLGCTLLVVLTALVIAVSVGIGVLGDDVRVALIVALDGLVILWLFWLTGMRFMLKHPNLAIRVNIILKMHQAFAKIGKEGEVFQPALLLARKGEGSVPVDARFSVAFPSSPEGLYGLQAQINLNIVQGTSYPYFYCVLAATPGFGLAAWHKKMPLQPKVICEYQANKDAEVLVLRQKTTKKSGYHTDDKACERILGTALHGGRAICSGTSE